MTPSSLHPTLGLNFPPFRGKSEVQREKKMRKKKLIRTGSRRGYDGVRRVRREQNHARTWNHQRPASFLNFEVFPAMTKCPGGYFARCAFFFGLGPRQGSSQDCCMPLVEKKKRKMKKKKSKCMWPWISPLAGHPSWYLRARLLPEPSRRRILFFSHLLICPF